MKVFISSFFVSLFLLVLIDFVWLGFSLPIFYKPYLSSIYSNEIKYFAVLVFYPLYCLALSKLVILPALLNRHSFGEVFLNALLFGLAAYGAYDLTNQATIKNWPVIVTFVDMAWGATVTSLVSIFTKKILTIIFR